MNLETFIALQIRKYPRITELLKKAAYKVSPESVALLDYPVHSRRRWDEENPHRKLYEIINRNRASYRADLNLFLQYMDYYLRIPGQCTDSIASAEPSWINGWMPAMDGVALYGYLAKNNPELYLEVGSGNSTKFARKAITDHNLKTKIVSIDPCPRVEINEICNEVIRKPVEDVDLKLFDRLGANDILYIDNSHRALMNSDATTLFIDVIPVLRPGVVVEIHDITLPYDYPADWIGRFYSEQYLLATFLLAQGKLFDIMLPCMFISHDDELKSILNPLWQKEEMSNVERHGCSFWLRMN